MSTFFAVLFVVALNAQEKSNSETNWFISNSNFVHIYGIPDAPSPVNNYNLNADAFIYEIPPYSLMSIMMNENLYNKHQIVEMPKNVVPRESMVTSLHHNLNIFKDREGPSESVISRFFSDNTDSSIFRTNSNSSKREIDWGAFSGYVLSGLSKIGKN